MKIRHLLLLSAIFAAVGCSDAPMIDINNELPEGHACNPLSINVDGESVEAEAGETASLTVSEGTSTVTSLSTNLDCTFNGNPEMDRCNITLAGAEVGSVTMTEGANDTDVTVRCLPME